MSDDNQKTVRSDGQNIGSGFGSNDTTGNDDQKTVRAGDTIGAGFDPDKTTAAGGVISARADDNQSTQRAGSSIIGAGFNNPLVNAQANEVIDINGTKYKMLKVISKSTGEAEIFLLHKEDGEKLILKLYFPNFDPNLELLTKFRNAQH